jgi:hypothetical protein
MRKMKIVLPEEEQFLTFGDLEEGEWFCFETRVTVEGHIRQKISDVAYLQLTAKGCFYNVKLVDSMFNSESKVRRLELELRMLGYA